MTQVGSADIGAYCDYYVDSLNAAGACRYMGVGLSSQNTAATLEQKRTSCKSAETFCLDAFPETAQTTLTECQTEWFGANCTATLMQVKNCTDDLNRTLAARYASVGSCDSASFELVSPTGLLMPESCVAALAICPTLFGDTTEPDTSSEPPVVTACNARCSEFVTACGLETCPASCSIERLVYGEECDAIGKRFYDCAAGKGFKCAETDLMLAIDGCQAERYDYVTCYGLEGVTCDRVTAYDSVCAGRDATRPYGKRCVSDAAPEDCTRNLSTGYYCCATE